MYDFPALTARGHVVIRDRLSRQVLADADNQINLENFVLTLAQGIADLPNGHIYQMAFGDGASLTTATGGIQYFPPNVGGPSAQLYNQTYAKVVDQQSVFNLNTGENFISVAHTANTTYADVVVTCALDLNEPADQEAFDSATSGSETPYIFDEMGLVAYGGGSPGYLLSHVIFNPVQKSLNRAIDVVYTIRLAMA